LRLFLPFHRHDLFGPSQFVTDMSFIARNPALTPLFAAVGAGLIGAGWYGFHTLRHNQDIIIDKANKPEPWQHVRQDQQTKLYTPPENREFWAQRAGMANPHDIYASAARKVKEIKQRTIG